MAASESVVVSLSISEPVFVAVSESVNVSVSESVTVSVSESSGCGCVLCPCYRVLCS